MLFNAFPNWLIRQIIVHKSHKYQANYACMLHCMCMYIWWHTSPAHGIWFLASLVFTSCCACLRSSQAFICCSIDSRSARQAVMIDFILRRMASRPQKSTKSREDRFEIMKNIRIIRYRSYILNTPIIKLYTLNVALNLNIKLKHFIHKTPQSNFHNPQEWSDPTPAHPPSLAPVFVWVTSWRFWYLAWRSSNSTWKPEELWRDVEGRRAGPGLHGIEKKTVSVL